MENNAVFSQITELALSLGSFRAAIIPVEQVETDEAFRAMCASNACGNYGRNWMCPPDAGDIHELMAELRTYTYALVYQTVSELEDSYDFEGMTAAGNIHNDLAQSLRKVFADAGIENALHLGAGGCRVCPVCAKRTGDLCRHPDMAMSSLEAYGIHVSRLAQAADMKYINGSNTVTYFGAIFFNTEEHHGTS